MNRPVTSGRRGSDASLRKLFSPWKNVSDIVQKTGPLSEKSSPLVVSQAGYWPAYELYIITGEPRNQLILS